MIEIWLNMVRCGEVVLITTPLYSCFIEALVLGIGNIDLTPDLWHSHHTIYWPVWHIPPMKEVSDIQLSLKFWVFHLFVIILPGLGKFPKSKTG